MITIIDYGMGNLRSVAKAVEFLKYDAEVTRDPEVIKKADKLILPGVGAFGAAMENLQKYNLIEPIKDAIYSGKPFLGICLGMQLLMESSDEQGMFKGLGIIKGSVVKFKETESLKIPQMGWNLIKVRKNSPIFADTKENDRVYFVHSYYVVPTEDVVAATCDYGGEYCCSIWKDNIYATQFHPEKSGRVGLKMLKHFAEVK